MWNFIRTLRTNEESKHDCTDVMIEPSSNHLLTLDAQDAESQTKPAFVLLKFVLYINFLSFLHAILYQLKEEGEKKFNNQAKNVQSKRRCRKTRK